MTILKTYARLWVDQLDDALPLLQRLTGTTPDLRFAFERVELAAIGDFLVIAGPPEERAKYATATATVIVADLDEVRAAVIADGGVILGPEARSETGRFLYVRQRGGATIEYVEWVPALVARILGGAAEASR